MRIFLDDSGLHDSFYPLTTLRSFKELRTGIFSVQERWSCLANKQHIVIEWVDNPDTADLIVPADRIPTVEVNLHTLSNQEAFNKKCFIHIQYVWDVILHNSILIHEDVKLMDKKPFLQHHLFAQQIGEHPLYVHENAIMEHCFVNTSDGPVIIDESAHIMSGAMLRGPLYIGKQAVVKMGSQLYGGTNIGMSCTVGGEIKNSILHAFSNKGHHGYLGDSYIGSWCNLGAGTTSSNVKNTAGAIRMWNHQEKQFKVGPSKIGVIMGDHVKTAINTGFNSGTMISSFSNVFTKTGKQAPKFLPMFSWGLDDQVMYKLDNLLEEINRWMEMKQQRLHDSEREKIISLYKFYNP